MNNLIAIFAAISPWVLGACIALNFSIRASKAPGVQALSAVFGGYAGHLSIALFLWGAHTLEINVLNQKFECWVVLLTIIVGISAITAKVKSVESWAIPTNSHLNFGTYILIFLTGTISVTSAYQHSLLPTHGWDVLSFWGHRAHEFLTLEAGETHSGISSTHRHPETLSFLSAWSASVTSEFQGIPSGQWPWLINWASIGLLAYGFSRQLNINRSLSVFIGYVATAIPLLENHGMIGGYSESFVTTSLALSCVFLTLSGTHKSRVLAGLGLLIGASAVLYRNTGLAYALLPIVGLVATSFGRRGPAAIVIVGSSVVLCIVALMTGSFDVEFLGHRLAFNPDQGFIRFAGRVLRFTDPDFMAIIENQKVAWFFNQSFSTIPLLFIILFVVMGREQLSFEQRFIITVTTFGLLLIVLSQFTVHGFTNATPSRDTGSSRFSIPIFTLVLLAAASHLGSQRKAESPSH